MDGDNEEVGTTPTLKLLFTLQPPRVAVTVYVVLVGGATETVNPKPPPVNVKLEVGDQLYVVNPESAREIDTDPPAEQINALAGLTVGFKEGVLVTVYDTLLRAVAPVAVTEILPAVNPTGVIAVIMVAAVFTA